jgi:hypothetical protein
VQLGLAGVQEAVGHFISVPARIGHGISVLGLRLLEAVDAPVRAHYNDTAAYSDFASQWMQFFEDAPTTVEGIVVNLQGFHEEGRPELLMVALNNTLTALADGLVTFVPLETAQEVVMYVDALSDVLAATGTAWVGFESGQEAQAIEDLYFGLRSALDQLIPDVIQNDETYGIIIGTLDGVVGNLTEIVHSFQQQIVEGAACWKTLQRRQRRRPSVCPSGYRWNGEQFCLPFEPTPNASSSNSTGGSSAASLLQTGAVAAGRSLEATTVDKMIMDGSASSKVRTPHGALMAHCVEGSNFSEKIGHWCYNDCPHGMQIYGGQQCITQCLGWFPADDGAMMCGTNPGVLANAILNMVVSVGHGIAHGGLSISDMDANGVDTDSLLATIRAFINMGRAFSYRTCPIVPSPA